MKATDKLPPNHVNIAVLKQRELYKRKQDKPSPEISQPQTQAIEKLGKYVVVIDSTGHYELWYSKMTKIKGHKPEKEVCRIVTDCTDLDQLRKYEISQRKTHIRKTKVTPTLRLFDNEPNT